MPGERYAAQIPEEPRHHKMFGMGGRTLESTKHGDVFEIRSLREIEKQRAEDQEDDDDYGGGYIKYSSYCLGEPFPLPLPT